MLSDSIASRSPLDAAQGLHPGMRISVSLIVNLVANRMICGEILAEHLELEEEDVSQALRYAV